MLIANLRTFLVKKLLGCNALQRAHLHVTSKFPKKLHSTPQIITTRTFYKRVFMKPSQQDLKLADNIPYEFDLIYRNQFSNYIYAIQVVITLTTAIICIISCFSGDFSSLDPKYEEWSLVTRRTDSESIFFMTAFVALIVIMQVFVTKIPIRIYKIPKTPKYILIFHGSWPFGNKRFTCEIGQVGRLPEKGILPWKENKYLIQKENESKQIILLDEFFKRPIDLSIMIGEQKDPDLVK